MTGQVMKILTSTEPLPIHITGSPPPCIWSRGNPIIRTRSLNNNHPNSFRLIRTWRIHAEAKGFNRAPPASTLQKRDRENGARESNKKSTSTSEDEKEDDEEIPEVVMKRIIPRILFYVGVPIFTGVVLMQVLSALKELNIVDVPYWLPYLTTLITFGASTLGIAFGSLSTSWDPNREGSFLGFEEAQKNWVEMWREDDDG